MACLLAMSLSLYSQEQRPFRHYATQQVHRQLLGTDAELSGNLANMEQHIRDYGTAGDDRKDVVAVVFHILHKEGMPYPSTEQVAAALDALNRDFGPYLAPAGGEANEYLQAYSALATDAQVSFCLPATGSGDDGPVRFVETEVEEWGTDDAMKSYMTGGSDPLPTSSYLNIWVCQLKDNQAGYAQMPGGPASTDGIVIDYDYLPGFISGETYPYKGGKSLTHLVGNYLGLYDLWNEEAPCTDDGVADTPIHNAPNYYPLEPGTRHISLCGEGPVDEMLNNFMDDTDDGAQNMFTAGQRSRMKAVLSENGPRSGLSAGCSQPLDDGSVGMRGKSVKASVGDKKLQLFPNPTSGSINLKLKGEAANASLSIFNEYGEAMHRAEVNMEDGRQSLRMDCSGWAAGLYSVAVVFSDGTRLNSVFTIVH
jgi:hypothetical protein